MNSSLLITEFAGIRFRHPMVVAASPLTMSGKHIIGVDEAGWAGAVTKTITSEPIYDRNLTPFIKFVKKDGAIIGLENNELRTWGSLNHWCDVELPLIKASVSDDFILIASIMEGPVPDIWATTALKLESSGASMLELNVSCPHGAPQKYRGSIIGDDPYLLGQIIVACRACVKIPIIVKLNAFMYNLKDSLIACEVAGADGITLTNTILSLPDFDIQKWSLNQEYAGEYLSPTGLSGSAIRPIGLHVVATAAQTINLPIFGCGGVDTWEHVAEYMALGASAVQLCSAPMVEGLGMVSKIVRGLEFYCNQTLHSKSLDIIKGKALERVVSPDVGLLVSQENKAYIDYQLCTHCQLCIRPCSEGATSAIILNDNKVEIDQDLCIGCGACLGFCPVDAIEMKGDVVNTIDKTTTLSFKINKSTFQHENT